MEKFLAKLPVLKYSILLPTYNERENLPILIYLIEKELFKIKKEINHEIIIIDDNSPDGTSEVAEELQNYYGNSKIILAPREEKLGIASAYKHGLKYATGDFVILMEADLSQHPKHIVDLISVQKTKDFDIVIGNRFFEEGSINGWSMFSKLSVSVLNLLGQSLFSLDVSDITCRYRLFKKSRLELLYNIQKCDSFAFHLEMLIRAKELNLSICEYPVDFVDRLYGESKYTFSETIDHYFQLYHMYRQVKY
eukprot:TRINITY_DN4907_c0_g1_i1.p1 TRINITY_DN4907_c0_g1~~TRINITY_DN4907_c0_g1_i1.p1  ORF type:complete len:251 (+),score=42.02 TRINITY_DN4907_c0_g1_i1:94-846(+)